MTFVIDDLHWPAFLRIEISTQLGDLLLGSTDFALGPLELPGWTFDGWKQPRFQPWLEIGTYCS